MSMLTPDEAQAMVAAFLRGKTISEVANDHLKSRAFIERAIREGLSGVLQLLTGAETKVKDVMAIAKTTGADIDDVRRCLGLPDPDVLAAIKAELDAVTLSSSERSALQQAAQQELDAAPKAPERECRCRPEGVHAYMQLWSITPSGLRCHSCYGSMREDQRAEHEKAWRDSAPQLAATRDVSGNPIAKDE